MNTLLPASLIYICLLLHSSVTAADTKNLKTCIGALNAFEVSMKNPESKLDTRWIRAKRGWLLVNEELSRQALDDLKGYVGDKEDISTCSTVGISAEEIELFIMAFHGYLSKDPFEDLSECIAVLIATLPEVDKVLGKHRSQLFGIFLGNRVGTTLTQLNYLYSSEKRSLEEVQSQADKLAVSLFKTPTEKRASTIGAYLSKCTLLHIPIKSILAGTELTTEYGLP